MSAPAPWQAPWRATVLTLFPDMFPGLLGLSLAGKALAAETWRLETVDIRAHARDRHRSVDDTAFGGGSGMVMRADVVAAAIDAVAAQPGPRIYLSPRGRRLEQSMVRDWATGPGLVLLCGRYEGLDQRCIDRCNLLEVSLGDFVLSGGEPAALALLIPTVSGCLGALPSAPWRLQQHVVAAPLVAFPRHSLNLLPLPCLFSLLPPPILARRTPPRPWGCSLALLLCQGPQHPRRHRGLAGLQTGPCTLSQ